MATIQASDVLPVRSRISWGAVLGGAFVSLAIYLVLMLGGVALGVTVANRMSDRALGIGAGLWTTVSLLLSLFIGGMVASRCSVGENKTEAAIYGVVVWGSFFFLLALLTAGTVNTGINAMLGVSHAMSPSSQFSDEDLRQFGFSNDQIARAREAREKARAEVNQAGDEGQSTGDKLRDAANDDRARKAAWWAFIGMALSIAAAVSGAVLGAGPTLVITSFRIRAATHAPVVEDPVREVSAR